MTAPDLMARIDLLERCFDVLIDAHMDALDTITTLEPRLGAIEKKLTLPPLPETVSEGARAFVREVVIDGKPRRFFDSHGFLTAIAESQTVVGGTKS